jgi:enhancer of polycomb-like protein
MSRTASLWMIMIQSEICFLIMDAMTDLHALRYIRHAMTLLTDADQQNLMTDASIPLPSSEGRLQMVVPFRLGISLPPMRRDQQGNVRGYVPPLGMPQGVALSHPTQQVNGTPIAMQQQLKKMPPPTALPQMRISSNGGMRTQAAPQSMQGSSHTPSHSPPNSASLPQPMTTGSNGLSRASITMPHVEGVKSEINSTPAVLNGAVQIPQPHQTDVSQSHDLTVNGISTSPPKHPIGMATNGYLNYAATALANTGQFSQQQGLTLQQMQNLKSAFANANIPPGQDLATFQANIARAGQFLHPNGTQNFNMAQSNGGANMNLKFPATRQMQWAASNAQKPMVNGLDGQTLNGSMSPGLGHTVPVRTPSANGTRPGMRIPNGQLNAHSISPHHHSPSPMPSVLAQSQSPPRLPLTPTMARASPSLQHQQAAGSSKSGY